MRRPGRTIDDVLRQHIRSAPKDAMEWDAARVLRRLRWERELETECTPGEPVGGIVQSSGWRRFALVSALGAIMLLMVIAIVWRRGEFGFVESIDDALSKAAQGNEALMQRSQSTDARDAFELASVKPLPPPPPGRGAPAPGPYRNRATGCPGGAIGAPEVNPGRLVYPAVTLFSLVTTAYGHNCLLVEGGPEWVRTDYFEIQAVMPPGTPSYTRQDLARGNAPTLQKMLQNLLADRFKLKVRHDVKETAVYMLLVTKDGKMKLSQEQAPPAMSIPRVPVPGNPLPWGATGLRIRDTGEIILTARAIPASELANLLQAHTGRAVVDRTGLKGLFDIRLEFVQESPTPVATGLPAGQVPLPAIPTGPLLFTAIEEQLGLKLQLAKERVDVLVIDDAERPSEN